jgi:Tfp pilus assembly protein PilN
LAIPALEINPKFIRAILLGHSGQNLIIKKIAEAPLPDGLISHGRLTNGENFFQILRDFLRRNHFSSSHWIVSLPEAAIFTTYKAFPNLAEEDLKEAVEINLATLIPGKIEENSWGWQKVDEEVMIASIAKKDLGDYLRVFDRAGIVPIAIEPKSCSIGRAFGKTGNILVLNIEGEILTSVIISAGFPRLAREFIITGAGDQQFKNLTAEIRRVMNFYLVEKNQKQIDSIILDGSGAKPELAQALSRAFNLEVKTASEVFQIAGFKVQTLPLVGAGLRGLIEVKDDNNLSLLPVGAKEAAEEKRTLLFYGGIANMVVASSVLLVMMFVGGLIFLNYLGNNLDGQLAKLSQSQSLNPEAKAIQKNLNDLQPYIEQEAKIEAQLPFWSGPIEEIAQKVPQEVTLTSISYPGTGETLTIIGQAASREALANFRDTISKLDLVAAVQLPSTNFSQEQLVNFTLNITFKKEAITKK